MGRNLEDQDKELTGGTVPPEGQPTKQYKYAVTEPKLVAGTAGSGIAALVVEVLKQDFGFTMSEPLQALAIIFVGFVVGWLKRNV